MIQATQDNIIVRLKEPPKEIQAGAVTLTKLGPKRHWQEENYEAVVISVGPLVFEVSTGDTVMIKGDVGKWIDNGLIDPDDKESMYRFVREDVILGIMNEVKSG